MLMPISFSTGTVCGVLLRQPDPVEQAGGPDGITHGSMLWGIFHSFWLAAGCQQCQSQPTV